jgi:ABC-2 type transport system permease protein
MVYNPTVASITARGLFGRRRVFILLPLPLLLVGLALLMRAYDVDPRQWGNALIVGLGLAVLLPITALIVGTGVLGSEIDDGTVVHILTKPLSRSSILLSKLLVAAGVTALVATIPLWVVGYLAGGARLGTGLAVGAALGAVVYSAIFLLFSLLTRRPVLLGLLYVLVWEGLLGRWVSGTRRLSVEQYVITVTDRIAPTTMLESQVSLPVSLVMAAVFAIGSTALAIRRLRSLSVAGETS